MRERAETGAGVAPGCCCCSLTSVRRPDRHPYWSDGAQAPGQMQEVEEEEEEEEGPRDTTRSAASRARPLQGERRRFHCTPRWDLC